jgi:hypothetical protein
MVSNLITRVVPLTDTALGIPALGITAVGITRTCTIGIVSPFTGAAISAVSPTPVKRHPGLDLRQLFVGTHDETLARRDAKLKEFVVSITEPPM